MEYLVEDLITRLEKLREKALKEVRKDNDGGDTSAALIVSGKVFAYDDCLRELRRLINYLRNSRSGRDH